eukprot:TRINITY_DN8216_c0_g1_i1.p1 TRINITY_DN8216_c0_g1~~TRINITY_DN8216_c0_g1_i1.p1  ORF type:complete len:503 (-),score=91.27 TRINITY_DN8216_c0_g1_i1:18-1526(-)
MVFVVVLAATKYERVVQFGIESMVSLTGERGDHYAREELFHPENGASYDYDEVDRNREGGDLGPWTSSNIDNIRTLLQLSPEPNAGVHLVEAKADQKSVLDKVQYKALTKLLDYVQKDDFYLLDRCPTQTPDDSPQSSKPFSLPCECPHGWMGMDCSIKKPCASCGLPDVVLLGTQKGGTSNIISAMALHPYRYRNRNRAVQKDKTFLNQNPPKAVYDRFFEVFNSKPLTMTQNFTMSGSAGYFTAWYSAAMLYAIDPNARFVVLIRDPVSRADSNLRMLFKFLTDPSLPFDMFKSSLQTIDACLADGRLLVDSLEEAMTTGVPAVVDFDRLIVPVNRGLFQRYNSDLPRLKQLKELITRRGVDFGDFMSFRLACNSLPRVEPLFTIYKSLYYYHTIIWFALFPRDRFLIIPSELLFIDEQAVVNQVSDFIGVPRPSITQIDLSALHLNNNTLVTSVGWNEEQRQMMIDWFRPHTEKFFQLLGVRDPDSPYHSFCDFWKTFC